MFIIGVKTLLSSELKPNVLQAGYGLDSKNLHKHLLFFKRRKMKFIRVNKAKIIIKISDKEGKTLLQKNRYSEVSEDEFNKQEKERTLKTMRESK